MYEKSINKKQQQQKNYVMQQNSKERERVRIGKGRRRVS